MHPKVRTLYGYLGFTFPPLSSCRCLFRWCLASADHLVWCRRRPSARRTRTGGSQYRFVTITYRMERGLDADACVCKSHLCLRAAGFLGEPLKPGRKSQKTGTAAAELPPAIGKLLDGNRAKPASGLHRPDLPDQGHQVCSGLRQQVCAMWLVHTLPHLPAIGGQPCCPLGAPPPV